MTQFVAVIKELASDVFGDAVVSLKVSTSVDLIKHQDDSLSGWDHWKYHFKRFHISLTFNFIVTFTWVPWDDYLFF